MPADPGSMASLADLRARLVALDEAHADGLIDAERYRERRRAAEHALSEAVLAMPALGTSDDRAARPASFGRPSKRLAASLVAVVVLIAIGGYAFTGSPSLATLGVAPAPVAANAPPAEDRDAGLQQIAEMVDKLAARMKERPDDAEGWVMLARSYAVLTRYRDALPAYQHAVALRPGDAGLLADYSDAIAAADGGKPDAQSLALIDRALAIDPKQPKALALSGTIAFDRGDYGTAVRQWQKIADALPPDSEFHQQVVANIDEARRRGGIAAPRTGGTPPSTAAAASIAAPPAAATATPPASGGREALTGTVTLSPSLAASASPDDTVFVLARPESGRMPLAVFRATVKDLPLRFKLDDSMAMTPTMKISDMKQVVVAARVSKSGNAITQPGDLSGEVGPVTPGSTGLSIVIGAVAPAR